MENLLELKEQLNRIESALLTQKKVLTFTDVSTYTGLSKSFLYKLTSTNKIPHSKPHGKVIYFDKSKIDTWLLENHIKTASETQNEANSYVTLNTGRA